MGNLKIVNDRDRDWPIKTVGITGLKKMVVGMAGSKNHIGDPQ